MLGFIQRYQKAFLIVVAAMVSISFLFFGMIPRGAQKNPDKVAYRTKKNQKIKQSTFEGLRALLNTNNGEQIIYGKALGPHFFTKSFIETEFLDTGLLSLIADKNFELIKDDLQSLLEKERRHHFYAHPSASFLNAETVWSVHAPKLKETVEQLQAETNLKKALEMKQFLYKEERSFSAFKLWNVLSQQESQFSWVPKDPDLNPERLQIFGYQNFEDWFGEKLIRKVCEFIFEVTTMAKKQGYQVTSQEAEQELLQLNELNYNRIKSLGIGDFEDSQAYFAAKLKSLGMNKMEIISLWRDLLTFRKFFAEAGNSVVLDSSTFKPFENYATEKMKVSRYSLPQDLKFRSFKDVMGFEVYLEALGKPLNQLSLKFKMHPLNEIAQSFPQLVEKQFNIKYKVVNLSNESLNIKMQDIWNWKCNQENFDVLARQFPELKIQENQDLGHYQDYIENLPPQLQAKIDDFVRMTLLKQNADWLDRAFLHANAIEQDVLIRRNGQGIPFKGFEISPLKEGLLEQIFAEDTQLISKEPTTYNDLEYYQIISVLPTSEERLVSFEVLKEDKTLDKLLQKRMKLASENVNNLKESTKDKEQELFDPLKKAIYHDFLAVHKEIKGELDKDFYYKYRLYHEMREALNHLKDQSKSEGNYSLAALWTLNCSQQTYIRYLATEQEMDTLLHLKVGQWTPVNFMDQQLSFCHLLEHPKSNNSHTMQKQLKKQINQELKRAVTAEILENL